MTTLQDLIHTLEDPAPQYVLGCIPVIVTIGSAPDNGLGNKLLWILRCLGTPFTGLLYTLNIKNDLMPMTTYWLNSNRFKEDGKTIPFRPFGHHAKEIILSDQDPQVIKSLEECIAEASPLDRLSSLASTYYVFVGIFAGLTKAMHIGHCTEEDWPYLPLALAWTLPAVYKRVLGGKVVVRDPRERLEILERDPCERIEKSENKAYIVVRDILDHVKNPKDASIFVITFVLFSLIIPWITVPLAYFSRPIGYGCRSKYLSLLCSIWTLNSTLAYISHVLGEKTVYSRRFLNIWFYFSGIIVAILLLLLALLSRTRSWWVDLFGESCSLTCSSQDY
ncbi:hypothetical protein RclHR1_00880011 [Rhizophagus clarus]|uniref:Uncharacterized protein n=1 Tax=Rhizophagus clarus TaxID=94130 RepID=A0A2Z6SNZ2_9GLOM|nr:hypothetical protein RclHR1_00880011 [Rhizophagus clarus]GES85335.1 hypothetical protein GLOIN_2v1534309 [Rhizophagus clarus]